MNGLYKDQSDDDYYTRKQQQRHRGCKGTAYGILVVILFALLFCLGEYAFSKLYPKKKDEIKRVNCVGYTVIDYDSVVWCDGRRIKYDWHFRVDKK